MFTPLLALLLIAQAEPPAHRIALYGPANPDDLIGDCREFIRWDKDDREGEPLRAQACLSYVIGVFDEQSFAGG
jgi:hypothetical protein